MKVQEHDPTAARKKILLVEDEAIIAMAESQVIRCHGYNVITARSGEVAIETIKADPSIDLVLMDIDLGRGIRGTEAAKKILELRNLPIVFLTSHAEREMVEKVRGITNYGYVIKNSGDFVLQSSIEMAFELFNTHKKVEEKEERLQLMNDSSADYIYSYNRKGQFTNANRSLCDALRLADDAIVGRTHAELGFPDEACREWDELHRKVYETNATVTAVTSTPVPGSALSFFEVILNPLHDKEGTIIGIGGATRNITMRKGAEAALRKSEADLAITLRSIGDGVISTDAGGNVVRMNPVAERLCGWALEDARGRPLDEVFRIVNADTGEKADNPVEKVMKDGTVAGLANHTMLISRDGREYQIADSAAPIIDETGQTGGVVLVFYDVTEKYAAQKALQQANEALIETNRKLQESEGRFRGVFEKSPIGIAIVDSTDQRIMQANKSLCALTGYSPDELAMMTIESITHPDDWQKEKELVKDYKMKPREPFQMEKRYVRKDGEIRLVRLTGDILEFNAGGPPLVVGNVVDITKQRQAEEELQKLLKEKELLLKEVHHRIKNNMNTMMSLLSLQSKTLKDPAAAAALQDARSRLQSMGVLYDRLYRSEGFREISMKDYLPPLIDEIVRLFPGRDLVTIETDVADFKLNADVVSPLGIIVNELITNTMKHAFTGRDRGVIKVSASLKGNRAALVIEDNGIGVPESVSITKSTGFGLQVVEILTQQLEGTIRLERGRGAKFILECEV